jgi:hypothetical protein
MPRGEVKKVGRTNRGAARDQPDARIAAVRPESSCPSLSETG